ncbi:MAG: hypothetical protein AAFO95_19555 [Cyanobacteria bacterium J06600_6]
MDEEDFKNSLRDARDGIAADYETIDLSLRDGKYMARITKNEQATFWNYEHLRRRKVSPNFPDPTAQDYRAVQDGIKKREEKLEADIINDIEKEFEEKGLIDHHLDAYFYDGPSKERAKKHLYHPVRTAFNEKSKKPLTRIFLEQVREGLNEKRKEAISKEETEQSLIKNSKENTDKAKTSRPNSEGVSKEDRLNETAEPLKDIQKNKKLTRHTTQPSNTYKITGEEKFPGYGAPPKTKTSEKDREITEASLDSAATDYPGYGSTYTPETNSPPQKGITHPPPKDGPTME